MDSRQLRQLQLPGLPRVMQQAETRLSNNMAYAFKIQMPSGRLKSRIGQCFLILLVFPPHFPFSVGWIFVQFGTGFRRELL